MKNIEHKSEFTLKDVEKAIKDSPRIIELVFLLSNNEHIIVKHTIK